MQVNSPDISDYLVSYKGHGMIEKATLTDSIGHVVAHENRHIQHYRSYAQFHDKEIVSEDISVRYAFIDGKLVAVAGKATAIMRDEDESNRDSIRVNSAEKAQAMPDVNSDGENSEKQKKLDVLLARIETALSKIDARLEKSEKEAGESNNSPGFLEIAQLKQKRVSLEAKKQEIAGKKNMIESEKLKKMVEDLLSGIAGLFDQAAGLIKANYAVKSGNQIGQQSDKESKIEVPDYSMLFTGIVVDTMI